MSACAYYRHECNDTTRDHFSMCGSAKFPPKVLEETLQTKPKPDAPETREEKKTVPAGQAAMTGKCQWCDAEGVLLYRSKSHLGDYCKKCNKSAMNRATNEKRKVHQSATKAHDTAKGKSAPPSKALAKIAQPRPAPAPSAIQTPAPTVAQSGRAVTLILTVHTINALRNLMAFTDGMYGVSVGLEG